MTLCTFFLIKKYRSCSLSAGAEISEISLRLKTEMMVTSVFRQMQISEI